MKTFPLNQIYLKSFIELENFEVNKLLAIFFDD